MSLNPNSRTWRTIWISDVHLGTRACQAELLLDFLNHNHAERLYLVGDIIDGWALHKRWYWDQFHTELLHLVFERAQRGIEVIYISGNHDEFIRTFLHHRISPIRFEDQVEHITADGKRLLVLHGDQFDGVMQFAPWLAKLGSWAYDRALDLNTLYNKCRHSLGYPYWSLSAYLKHKTKSAISFISAFEELLANEARKRGLQGIVCGHIHHAEIREVNGILYCNDGDWVESCSALVEDWDGSLQILKWTELTSSQTKEAQAQIVTA